MSWPVVTQPQPGLGFSSGDSEWSSGICDCCEDIPECCFACWCCPCFACITTKAYGQCLCLPLLEICGGCINPITMSMRVSVRHRYGIKGSLCRDCVCATFCPPCVWCQISREMRSRKLPTVLSDIIRR
ncbi:cornifelin homolog B-like [Cheilinus undulatus]|uniref:cornifelin homolog B-like n=1 Tax=Cheilinus undulatus TaxID=241271 RepID=UPI001BD6415F|nr:cornifelin homolog B-like [Cheilinus undulatus]